MDLSRPTGNEKESVKYLKIGLKEHWIWRYHRLIWRLTINDLKVKYNNTVLGFIWSLLNPILTMIVLYAIFINFRHLEQDYALYLLTGIIAYRFFTQGTNSTMKTIQSKSSLISNYALPRQIFVLEKSLSAFISFFLEFIVLIPLVMIISGILSKYAILFPLIHLIYLLLVYGLGLIIAAVYPYFRDLGEIWGVVTQLGFFACPILYPISIIPESILPYYMLNPLTHLITMYRQIVMGGELPGFQEIGYVILVGLVLLIIGSLVFGRLQKRFVEVI